MVLNYSFSSPPSSHNQTFYCPDQHQSGTAKLRLIPGHVDLLQGCSNIPSHRLVHCEALENSDLPRQIIKITCQGLFPGKNYLALLILQASRQPIEFTLGRRRLTGGRRFWSQGLRAEPGLTQVPPVALLAPRPTNSSYPTIGWFTSYETFSSTRSIRTVSKADLEEETYRLGNTYKQFYQLPGGFKPCLLNQIMSFVTTLQKL